MANSQLHFALKAMAMVILFVLLRFFYVNVNTVKDVWEEQFVRNGNGTWQFSPSNPVNNPNSTKLCYNFSRGNPSALVQDLTRRLAGLTNVMHKPSIKLLEETLNSTTADLPSLLQETERIQNSQSCVNCVNKSSLPANLVGSQVGLPSCGYWKGFRLPVIAQKPIGRLGNVMGEYATLFALKETFNVTAMLTKDHEATLKMYFPHLSLPLIEIERQADWTALPEEAPFYPFFGALTLAAVGLLGSRPFLSTGYPFDMRLFNAHRDKIRHEFTFTDEIVSKAQEFLSQAAAHAAGLVPDKPISFVGVHIRRTDYMAHMKIGYGLQTVDYKQFIERAIHHYESKLENLVFIVASDDFNYSTAVFNSSGQRNVFFSYRRPSSNSSLASEIISVRSPGDDMSLLAQCNHSIITLGSFGFWTGYLSPGMVVYPDFNTSKPYITSEPFYEAAKIDEFFPIKM